MRKPLLFAISLLTTAFCATAQSGNTKLGTNALATVSTGDSNTAVGHSALYKNTSGSFNSALGARAMYKNSSGFNNTAVGYSALYSNTTGGSNAAFGYKALYYNTATGNTATGYRSLYMTTTGGNNTATGRFALYSNKTGYSNAALGAYALYANTSGAFNTAIGDSALRNNTTGYFNIAIGGYAMVSNTTGSSNTATGYQALFSNTTGYNNTAMGLEALYSNVTGYYNTALGVFALNRNNSGIWNTATGMYALYNNTTGRNNTASGVEALGNNTGGQDNTATGVDALTLNDIGNYNTAIGKGALYYNTTNSSNTAIGFQAGGTINYSYRTATFLGAQTGSNVTGLSNITAVGYGAINTASNQIMLGNTSVTSVKAAGNYVVYSDGRYKKNIQDNVPGLDFIKGLRPITYTYDIRGLNERISPKSAGRTLEAGSSEEAEAIAAKEKKLYSGFIAQEVEQAAQKLNYDFSGVYKPTNEKDVYGLSYADFVVPLVKAVQELSKKNEELEKKATEVDVLKQEVAELKALITGKNTFSSATPGSIELAQNTPNPFNRTTIIHYFIPAGGSKADLVISDYSGKVIKTSPINNTGSGSVTIDASLLSSGTYNYSITVDGRTITTKKMIVAK